MAEPEITARNETGERFEYNLSDRYLEVRIVIGLPKEKAPKKTSSIEETGDVCDLVHAIALVLF
jgi:hypothetical protein